MPRKKLKEKKRIVIKVGTSSLTHPNGKLNYTRIEKLTRVLSDLQSSGRDVLLVSSGAIAVGSRRMGLNSPPEGLIQRQALASIGQAELIRIYQKFFDGYDQVVSQVLLTWDGLDDEDRRNNAKNTLNELLRMKIIPIINENDTVSTAEIQFGDNDSLSAKVSVLVEADLLIILSDIDGLYSVDPKKKQNAKIISQVNGVSREIEDCARGPNSSFARGGMVTKLSAVKQCHEHNIDAVIINGKDPENIIRVLKGNDLGTLFVAGTKILT